MLENSHAEYNIIRKREIQMRKIRINNNSMQIKYKT